MEGRFPRRHPPAERPHFSGSAQRGRMAEQIKPSLKDFLVVHPGPWAHGVALRAGISMLVPLLVLVAMGRPEWSAYAAFGAFASLYGRNHIHLSRAVMQASAGALLTVSVVAVLGSVIAAVQDWHPPGPLFLVFAFGAVAGLLRRQRSRPRRLAPPRPADAVRCALPVLLAGGAATAVDIGHP
jgi:hypothetical protein